jgi:hypothetical protein
MEQEVIHVNKWGVFEATIPGNAEGNPFVDEVLTGIFTSENESVFINGFYDGDGIYKIRFMPSYEGTYSFVLHASFTKQVFSGTFIVDAPKENNHGPVHVKDQYHFEYADGTPYVSIGTTSYVWHLQDEETKNQTLESLKNSPFNKMRFCVFPKHYVYNFKDPEYFPYVGTPMDASVLNEDNFMDYTGKSEGNNFDKTRFDPQYFRNIEEQIQKLGDLGIEADLILFHPYDRWGFSSMTREEDELYLKYIIARFSAYHNVWWAMANEWDLFEKKSVEDFEYNAAVLVKNDPYDHLRSIHNCLKMYDHSKEWITHTSYQRIDLYKTVEVTDSLREEFKKPVVIDELGYEGNIQFGWGNLTGEEELRRFWETAMRGGYPGHGETYLNDENILWWAHGGTLRGESYKKFEFLKKIMEEVPGSAIAPLNNEWDSTCAIPQSEVDEEVKSQYIFYYGFQRPGYRDFYIDDETDYAVDVLDTWNTTVRFAGVFHGKFRIALPSQQYIAVRLTKASEEDLIREVDVTYKSYHLKEEHPFVKEEETKEEAVVDLDEKEPVEPIEMDEDDYLEPTVVKDNLKENSPFEEEEEVLENDLDEEIDEPIAEEPVVTPFDNVLDEDEFEYEELDLPEPDKYEGDDEDELPAIVTGSIPTFAEKKKEPVVEEQQEVKKQTTFKIPLNFFKK